MPFNGYGPFPDLNTIHRERELDRETIRQIERNRLRGRVRNTGALARAIPTSATDVLDGDAEGDLLFDASYRYEARTINGTLTWVRIALDSGW